MKLNYNFNDLIRNLWIENRENIRMNLSRDENLLDSALKSPFQTFDGSELYPDILDKASQLCYSLVENHPFADGNNASGKMNKDDIKAWFLTHRK